MSREGSQGKSYYLNGQPRFILFVPEFGKFLYVFLGIWCGAFCFFVVVVVFFGFFFLGGGGGSGGLRVQILLLSSVVPELSICALRREEVGFSCQAGERREPCFNLLVPELELRSVGWKNFQPQGQESQKKPFRLIKHAIKHASVCFSVAVRLEVRLVNIQACTRRILRL